MKFPKISKKLKKIREIPRKFSEKIKKSLDNDDRKVLKATSLEIIIYGLMANYSLSIIFNQPFTWYSWIGYGFVFILVENKLIKWLRKLWFK